MTATTLPRDARLNVALFTVAPPGSAKPKMRFEKRTLEGKPEPTDVLIVEDLPVFRSGSFRDSMGYQHTWESLHMDQLVAHFNLLKDRGILADVPTRAGHPGFLTNDLRDVIGYHTGLRVETRNNPVDGKEYQYLLATFEVLDPDAIEKISSGLWRNVSAEVGPFLSNDEAEFWPVYQGVAYVDIPAVEGLKGFSNHNGVGTSFSVMLDANEEAPVGETPTTPAPSATSHPAPQTAKDTAYHGRAQFMFSIKGQQTNDFAAVQAHVNGLEATNAALTTAATETKAANRKEFIKSLADGPTPKILASQIPHIEAYALGMDDTGWAAFEKAHTEAPAVAAVSSHTGSADGSATNETGTTPVGGSPSAPDEVETAAEVVQQFKRQGMKVDKIKATPSYQKVKAAKPDHPVLAGIPA